jgi:hypothetical protein
MASSGHFQKFKLLILLGKIFAQVVKKSSWWAHQDSNLEPDRYEEWAPSRKRDVTKKSATFTAQQTPSCPLHSNMSGSTNLRTDRLLLAKARRAKRLRMGGSSAVHFRSQ